MAGILSNNGLFEVSILSQAFFFITANMSFSAPEIFVVFFHLSIYLFYLMISFSSLQFFIFIGAKISTISCFLFIIENLYYITSMNFSFSYLAISFFPKPPQFYLLNISPKYFTHSHFSGHCSC